MSVDWDGYEPYQPIGHGPLQDRPRREARAEFNKLMSERRARAAALRDLLHRNGVELVNEDAAVQAVNDWFRSEVEPDPEQPGRMTANWYAVINDLGLFIGDSMIERSPNLRWDFFTHGKRNLHYQRAVIMGFTDVQGSTYSVDPARVLAGYGHRIVASRGSVAHYGKVSVRGVVLDIDAIARSDRSRMKIKNNLFVEILRSVQAKA